MCFPALAAIPALAALASAAGGTAGTVGLIGAGLTAASAVAGGIAQNKASKVEAKQAKREGILAQNQSVMEQRAITQQRRSIAGSQKVAAAKSGRGFSGSVLDVAQASESNAELDILSSVYGGKLASQDARFNAKAARTAGKNALIGGVAQAGSTLLTGGAQYLQ
jgi:hypothetical protein